MASPTSQPPTHAIGNRTGQPIYQHSVGRWKHYAAHIGPLLRMFEEPPTTEIEAT